MHALVRLPAGPDSSGLMETRPSHDRSKRGLNLKVLIMTFRWAAYDHYYDHSDDSDLDHYVSSVLPIRFLIIYLFMVAKY